ncbi:hypothetical protein E3N88_32485 [Mikania micrantha]|uniref:Uncharacterized protein n=1 Tax=Mikania micrantha TaxID=192012 RepID=A0A5N6M8J0_9ASTR|nr:hypothetical protein E3N88_32470 [Mikania micrantha]KAD3336965.1 hypothetical protein E3N88_32485 [Mikania micrantha]
MLHWRKEQKQGWKCGTELRKGPKTIRLISNLSSYCAYMEAGASSHGGMEGNRNDRDQRSGERESRGDSKSGALCGSALVLI